MKIKLIHSNDDQIERELARINGKSSRHVFTTYVEIIDKALHAEQLLLSLGMTRSKLKGVRCVAQSGERLASAYRNKARATTAYMYRGASDWFLTDVQSTNLWPNTQPFFEIMLTPEHDEYLVGKLRTNYRVQGTSDA